MHKRILFVLILVGLLLSGCNTSSRNKGLKPSEGWSRSVEIGRNAAGSVSMTIDADNNHTVLVWTEEIEDEIFIHLSIINENSQPLFDTSLDLPKGYKRHTKLVQAGPGQYHIFWSNRVSGEKEWTFWHTVVNAEGVIIKNAEQISGPGQNLDSFDVAEDGAGGAAIVWAYDSQPGIMYALYSGKGLSEVPPELISDKGKAPSLRVGKDGQAHLVFLDGQEIEYGAFPLSDPGQFSATHAVHLAISGGNTLFGPVVGLSDGWVYIIWSELKQTGLESGKAHTEYISFVQGTPRLLTSQRLGLMSDEELSYSSYHGSFGLEEIAEPGFVSYTSDYVYQPFPMQLESEELAVAVTYLQQHRLDFYHQIAVVLFEKGKFSGYSVSSKTINFSNKPTLAVNAAGDLFVAWSEGASGSKIYYSSTADPVEEELGRLDSGDWLSLVLQGSMEALTGMMFSPSVGLGIIFPGLVVVGIYKLFQDYETIEQRSSKLVVAAAILIYQGMKFFFIAPVKFYVPFSAWIEMPLSWHLPLRIMVPVIIFLVGLLIANRIHVKRGGSSSVLFYLSQTIPDAVLTLAIYGVVILGVM